MSFPKVEDRVTNGGNWNESNYLKTVAGIKNMKVALMILRGSDLFPRSNDVVSYGIIDVWWIIHEGGLLLLLPYILSKNHVWGRRGAKLRIFVITTRSTENPKKLGEAVTSHLAQARIGAAVTVVDMSETTINLDMSDGQDDAYSKTVGEWFSNASYEVPYVALSDYNDLELGNVDEADEVGFEEDKKEDYIDNDSPVVDDTGTRMKNAKAFNEIIKSYSSESNLVVTNMPQLHEDFFDYVDVMCDGLDNVLLIKGSGKEVITTYA